MYFLYAAENRRREVYVAEPGKYVFEDLLVHVPRSDHIRTGSLSSAWILTPLPLSQIRVLDKN